MLSLPSKQTQTKLLSVFHVAHTHAHTESKMYPLLRSIKLQIEFSRRSAHVICDFHLSLSRKGGKERERERLRSSPTEPI